MMWTDRSFGTSHIQRAISEYKKMMNHDPNSVRIRLKLADLYLRNKNTDQAIREYIQVAKLYEQEDLILRAISIYKKILNLNPAMVQICHRLADLYKSQGLLGDAKALYQRILKFHPGDQTARRALQEIEKTISVDAQCVREKESTVDSSVPWVTPSLSTVA